MQLTPPGKSIFELSVKGSKEKEKKPAKEMHIQEANGGFVVDHGYGGNGQPPEKHVMKSLAHLKKHIQVHFGGSGPMSTTDPNTEDAADGGADEAAEGEG